jgi:hypothetical protein
LGALLSIACAGKSNSKATMGIWIARLVAMLRADRASDVFDMLSFVSMVVTKQPHHLMAARCLNSQPLI